MDSALPAYHRMKIKESENINKYLEFTRELKQLWDMRVTVIPVVFSALGMVLNILAKRQEELEIRRIETIEDTEWIRSARIRSAREESRRPKETCCHSNYIG